MMRVSIRDDLAKSRAVRLKEPLPIEWRKRLVNTCLQAAAIAIIQHYTHARTAAHNQVHAHPRPSL
ncbi:hypothetical protein E2C01_061951 [Portunus trituberculatus]|uniref:Uncharacterized protein n=1 Tax=Portunus trituberculatus TaxID=210409 RepID=A0A5B7HEL8_PORTR|nr:hypothetical protein [Portunus trituberculatus]